MEPATYKAYEIILKLETKAKVTGWGDIDVYAVRYSQWVCIAFDAPMFWPQMYLLEMSGSIMIKEPDNVWTNIDEVVRELKILRIK
jgi:hypothetical protein